eukprot:scaffold224260_cov29-Prasinocladus_malaysianus.AAC.1
MARLVRQFGTSIGVFASYIKLQDSTLAGHVAGLPRANSSHAYCHVGPFVGMILGRASLYRTT